jgi:hypothetical protein
MIHFTLPHDLIAFEDGETVPVAIIDTLHIAGDGMMMSGAIAGTRPRRLTEERKDHHDAN